MQGRWQKMGFGNGKGEIGKETEEEVKMDK